MRHWKKKTDWLERLKAVHTAKFQFRAHLGNDLWPGSTVPAQALVGLMRIWRTHNTMQYIFQSRGNDRGGIYPVCFGFPSLISSNRKQKYDKRNENTTMQFTVFPLPANNPINGCMMLAYLLYISGYKTLQVWPMLTPKKLTSLRERNIYFWFTFLVINYCPTLLKWLP